MANIEQFVGKSVVLDVNGIRESVPPGSINKLIHFLGAYALNVITDDENWVVQFKANEVVKVDYLGNGTPILYVEQN